MKLDFEKTGWWHRQGCPWALVAVIGALGTGGGWFMGARMAHETGRNPDPVAVARGMNSRVSAAVVQGGGAAAVAQPVAGHVEFPVAAAAWLHIPAPGMGVCGIPENVANKFGMSPEQHSTVNAICARTLAALVKLEEENAVLVTNAPEGQYFEVRAFPERGAELKANMEAQLCSALGPDMGVLIGYSLTRQEALGRFGNCRRQVYVSTQASGENSAGGEMLTIKLLSAEGASLGVERISIGYGGARRRFEHLFRLVPQNATALQ